MKNKKISVLGICRSGVYAAILLKNKGNEIYLSDISTKESEEFIKLLNAHKINYEYGCHNYEKLLESEIIVTSPGIPESSDILKFLRKHNKYVISEIEAAYRFIDKPIIAITGSNGKTTVTTLIGKILNDAGYIAPICGNIGFSLSRALLEIEKYDCIVLEVSSFQLDTIDKFRPNVSVLTNITPNHLDRYANFDEYKLSKKRIFKNQTAADFAVINAADDNSMSICKYIKPQKVYFNVCEGSGLFYKDKWICKRENNSIEKYIDVSRLKIFGEYNYENIMFAVLVVKSIFDIDDDSIISSVEKFEGVEHRIEFVAEINKVKYYNDSKATTVDALQKSLKAFDKPVILIAGGRDKNADFTVLRNLIKDKVKKLILTGEASEKMNQQINLEELTILEKDFDAAVKLSKNLANIGDIVLLSPACASYDKFNNFEERGRYFKKLVLEKL